MSACGLCAGRCVTKAQSERVRNELFKAVENERDIAQTELRLCLVLCWAVPSIENLSKMKASQKIEINKTKNGIYSISYIWIYIFNTFSYLSLSKLLFDFFFLC